MSTMTTDEVVKHLDQYVIGQLEPKRAIALAYRERTLKAENTGAEWKYITPSNILMVGPSGSGKAQPLTAQIKVPGGWKFMRDIKLHDLVSTPDGQSAPVTGVYPQGIKTTARLTFKDGRSTRACWNHLWKVTVAGKDTPIVRILTTGELDTLMRKDTVGNLRISVELITHEDQDPEVELPIDPYLLGVLLGDGSLTRHTVKLSNPDQHIIDKVNSILAKDDCSLGNNENNPIEYWVRKNQRDNGKPAVLEALEVLGLMGEASWGKFVPDEYLSASRTQRLALLQGLMDTDGTAGQQGGTQYCTTSKKLCYAVMYLVRSLGGICKVSEKIPSYSSNGVKVNGRTAYTLSIRHKRPTELFTLPKKQDRVKDDHQYAENMRLTLVSIDDIKKEVCQCIMVHHPDHLYITDDFIVTHNTELARQLADMTNSPFVKCEITEFTQVGYYGRDVKSILTDLVNDAVRIAPAIWAKENKPKLSKAGRDMLTLMLKDPIERATFSNVLSITDADLSVASLEEALLTKSSVYRKLSVGYHWYGDSIIAAHAKKTKTEPAEPEPDIVTNPLEWAKWSIGNKFNPRGLGFTGNENEILREAANLLDRCGPKSELSEKAIIEALGEDFNTKRKKIMQAKGNSTLKYLRLINDNKNPSEIATKILRAVGPHSKIFIDQLIDITSALRTSSEPPADFIVKLVEERGIVFIDEFDKIFVDLRGSNVGNMGVVRDLMPYLDGVIADVPTVTERESRGMFGGRGENYQIDTSNILWIASGAFHLAKVTDVPAEILGRLPVHVTLNQLKADDLEKVLIKPHGSIIAGITLLLKAEGIDFSIEAGAIRAIAELTFDANTKGEDTGARRLKGVCRELFGDILFTASNLPVDQRKIFFTEKQVLDARERILATISPRKVKKDGTDKEREQVKMMVEAMGALHNIATGKSDDE